MLKLVARGVASLAVDSEPLPSPLRAGVDPGFSEALIKTGVRKTDA